MANFITILGKLISILYIMSEIIEDNLFFNEYNPYLEDYVTYKNVTNKPDGTPITDSDILSDDRGVWIKRTDMYWAAVFKNGVLDARIYGDKTFIESTDSLPVLRNIQKVMYNGGLVQLDEVTYNCSNGIDRWPSNITVRGKGINKTNIVTRFFDVDYGSRVASDYPVNTPDILYTYMNATKRGEQFIDLKDALWASNFEIGDVIIIMNGGAYFDQDYCEQNEIVRISGARLYLKFNLIKNYNTYATRYYGLTTQDFIQPPVGGTISVATGISTNDMAVGRAMSIGDNIYIKVSSTSTQAILMNPGRGNSIPGSVIPSGSKISKGRFIIISRRARYVTFEDLTIISPNTSQPVRLLRDDNAYATRYNRCRFEINPGSSPNGNISVYFTDNSSYSRFTDCEFISPYLFTTQISRSACRIYFDRCTFTNVIIDASEFASDIHFRDNIFNMFKVTGSTARFFGIGNTLNNFFFQRNTIYASKTIETGSVDLFDRLEIQERGNVSDTNIIEITDNFFYCENIRSVAYSSEIGLIKFNNNKIFGSVDSFGMISRSRDSGFLQNNGNLTELKNNEFIGSYSTSASVDFLSVGGNLHAENNYFEFVRPVDFAQNNYIKTLLGVINTTDIRDFRFNNNIFNKFILKDSYYTIPSSILQRSNNSFENNSFTNTLPVRSSASSSYALLNDNFLLTLRSSLSNTNYDMLAMISNIKNIDADVDQYIGLLNYYGGGITENYRNIVRTFLQTIYTNNLRDKIVYLNLSLGNSTTALVPIIGATIGKNRYDLRTPRIAKYQGSMGEADFVDTRGYKGDGLDKRLFFAALADIDIRNAGLFVQVTDVSTQNTQTEEAFIGHNLTNFSIRKTGGTLRGLGDRGLKASYIDSVGFIWSGSANGNSTNSYLDTAQYPNEYTSTLNGSSLSNRNLLGDRVFVFARGESQQGNYNLPSSVGLGAFGITTSMTQAEITALKTALRTVMVSLGRPVQAGA